jgi:hypothetical protein
LILVDCEICGLEVICYAILPIKQEDGKLDTIVCLSCARRSSAYCLKHDVPHVGFTDGTTACFQCIETGVAENRYRQDEIFIQLKESLLSDQFAELLEYTECATLIGETVPGQVVRALATKAVRTNQTIDDVLKEVILSKTVDSIFPRFF